MPSPYVTDNPLEFTQFPGVYISEKAPPPTVIGTGTNNVILIGQFERGPVNEPHAIGSTAELQDLYGNNPIYTGNKALRLKRWNNLHVIRAVAAAASEATITQTITSKNTFTATALYKGVYGNKIKITVADGTNANTKKFTVTDEGTSKIVEVYDNLTIQGSSDTELQAVFENSKLVKITSAHATEEPGDGTLTLAGGTDGVIASTDYTNAINNADINLSGKIYFTDDQSAGVKAALSNFVKTEQAGLCVVGPSTLTVGIDDAITDAKLYLDSAGRVLYAYNPLKFNINGVLTEESPVYMAVSVLGLVSPQVSPAAARTTRYTSTAADVKYNINRTNFIKLYNAGIMAFENDPDLRGIKLAMAPTGNPQLTVQRRRVTDFYLKSVAFFLKYYQSEPISAILKQEVVANIESFDQTLINNGVLPSEQDVGRKVLLVRTDGVGSADDEKRGILKIEIQRVLFSPADFIVVEATIGETVEVREVS